MSTDFTDDATRSFYGAPQHETRPPMDAERARVVSPPSIPSERDLCYYAKQSSPDRSEPDRASEERRRAQNRALRRRVKRAQADGEARARGVMVRW